MKKLSSAFALMSSLCLLFTVSCNDKPRKKTPLFLLKATQEIIPNRQEILPNSICETTTSRN